ncbi:MAG TPA: hypothetical protein VJH55_00640 [Candidatus Paceibacterota bacterium]
MKICFFLQRRFASIGHALACNLKERHGIKDFCAYVSMRESYEFLTNQTDIAYTSLLSDEDIHKKMKDEKLDMEYLKNLEREYGNPNLWPYLFIDRIVMHGQLIREYPHDRPLYTEEEMLRLLQVTAKEIIGFLDREKPDVLVISVVASLGSSLLYFIAQKKGIKTINLEQTRIGNRIALSESYKNFTWATKRARNREVIFAPSVMKDARAYIERFRAKPTAYNSVYDPEKNQVNRRSQLRFLRPANLAWSILWHAKELYRDIRKKNRDFDDVRIWWLLWDKVKRKARTMRGYNDLYSSVDWNKPFAFYPLHVDPEMATMLLAPCYTNQPELIRQIARALPVGYTLYVKEHVVMSGYRPRSYYRDIVKIPNVKLVHPAVRGFDLAKAANIVVTISGTAGFEAVILGNPTITFGEIFYNDLSFVKRIRSIEELPFVIRDQLNHFKCDEEELTRYVAALFEESVDVDYMDLWLNAKSDEEIRRNAGITRLADLLAKKILAVTDNTTKL